ncbi:MAG TPA: VWA domain-containing protein, partial [Myxococcales bacterium]|nr:VWA domain-containing protein [Myxococcales bacterium]
DVSARATDIADPGETVDAVVAFLDRLETRSTAAAGLSCTTGWTTIDAPGIDADSYPDTFQNVVPGNPVCFDIVPRMNTTVMPTLDPQLFRARIDVLGDGFTPLDDRIVFFLVPPRIPPPNE